MRARVVRRASGGSLHHRVRRVAPRWSASAHALPFADAQRNNKIETEMSCCPLPLLAPPPVTLSPSTRCAPAAAARYRVPEAQVVAACLVAAAAARARAPPLGMRRADRDIFASRRSRSVDRSQPRDVTRPWTPPLCADDSNVESTVVVARLGQRSEGPAFRTARHLNDGQTRLTPLQVRRDYIPNTSEFLATSR